MVKLLICFLIFMFIFRNEYCFWFLFENIVKFLRYIKSNVKSKVYRNKKGKYFK